MHEKFTEHNMCIQPSMTFKIWFKLQVFIEIACFPYGQLPSVEVDKHHDGCPSKVAYIWNLILKMDLSIVAYRTLNWFSGWCNLISAMLKVPDGTFSWKWFKSLAQRSDLNLVGSTWSPK